MIINFHEHPWEGVGDHNASMGIDRMVLLADRESNELVCDMAKREPGRFMAANHPNVYLDIAYLHFFCDRSLPKVEPIHLVKRAVEFAGAERVVYASEDVYPSVISHSDLPQNTKDMILCENAQRQLGEL